MCQDYSLSATSVSGRRSAWRQRLERGLARLKIYTDTSMKFTNRVRTRKRAFLLRASERPERAIMVWAGRQPALATQWNAAHTKQGVLRP
jgi:hypothetical protein